METTSSPIDSPAQASVRSHHALGWRYILVELAIVTAGLFIALMLNGVVEWAHHKQLVHDARRNIQHEIRENRQKIRENIGYVQKALAKVDANIVTLHRMLDNRFIHGSLNNGIDYDSFDVAAWETARDTGALSYMPYDEVQRYSGLYTTIDYVNARALSLGDAQFNAMAPAEMGYDIAHLPRDEIQTMLRGNAQAKIGLETMTQILTELDGQLAKDSAEPDGR